LALPCSGVGAPSYRQTVASSSSSRASDLGQLRVAPTNRRALPLACHDLRRLPPLPFCLCPTPSSVRSGRSIRAPGTEKRHADRPTSGEVRCATHARHRGRRRSALTSEADLGERSLFPTTTGSNRSDRSDGTERRHGTGDVGRSRLGPRERDRPRLRDHRRAPCRSRRSARPTPHLVRSVDVARRPQVGGPSRPATSDSRLTGGGTISVTLELEGRYPPCDSDGPTVDDRVRRRVPAT